MARADGDAAVIDRSEFAALVAVPEERLNLAAAALALARIQGPVAEPAHYLGRLDDLAADLRPHLGRWTDPWRALERLGRYLAGEQGFHGNTRAYSDPRNSCLNHVLDQHTGIPISLSVVYLEVGWRVGLPLAGVGMPGHFLIKYAHDGGEVIADPFHDGAILSPEDCAQRLRQIYSRPVPLEPHYLAAVTRKQILLRMLTNLKHIYLRAPAYDYARGLETIEHLLVLSPWALDEVRDRGMVHWQMGQIERAVADLETYLRFAADADDAPLVRQRLASLRRRGGAGRDG